MRIRLSEPTNPRYLFIDSKTNTVHLMVPVTTGVEIGADNTCKTVLALQEFFGKRADSNQRESSARHELRRYKRALEDDLGSMMANDPAKRLVQDRLDQVNIYINLLEQIEWDASLNPLTGGFPNYPQSIKDLLVKPQSNLYAMHLRPSAQDGFLRTQAPTFSVERQYASRFYQQMMQIYPSIQRVVTRKHRDRLKIDVEHKLNEILPGILNKTLQEVYKTIGETMTASFKNLFPGYEADIFTNDLLQTANDYLGFTPDTKITTKAELNELVDGIINSKDNKVFPLESSFNDIAYPVNSEKLSIMTQFLLAEINFFVKARKKSTANFGRILDTHPSLATQLSQTVQVQLQSGQSVEDAVFQLVNNNRAAFSLNAELTREDKKIIFERFNTHYQTIIDSPHMDEFMVLDPTPQSPPTFFTHQNSICFNFADLMETDSFRPYRANLRRMKNDMPRMPVVLESRDETAVGYMEIDKDRFAATMYAAIINNDFTEAKKLLLITDETDNNEKLRAFEVLGRDFFSQFDNNEKAQKFFIQLRRSILDAPVSNSFNKVVRGQDSQLLLTPEMARSLYVAVQDCKLLPLTKDLCYGTAEDMQFILDELKSLGLHTGSIYSVTAGYNGTLVIDTNAETVRQLSALIERYKKSIHLTMTMAKSIYQQVGTEYGEKSAEYIAMQAENNNKRDERGVRDMIPHKLLYALRLLNFDISHAKNNARYNNTLNDLPLDNKGGRGFVIDNIEPDDLRRIEELTEFQGNRLVISHEFETALYNAIASLDRGAYSDLNAYSNRFQPDKLETALALLGLDYRRVDFNPTPGNQPKQFVNNQWQTRDAQTRQWVTYDPYVVYMPPMEQAKLRAIVKQYYRNHGETGEQYLARIGKPWSDLDRDYTQNYRATVQQPDEKTTRGYMLNQIKARAQQRAQEDQGPILRVHHGDAAAEAVVDVEPQAIVDEPPPEEVFHDALPVHQFYHDQHQLPPAPEVVAEPEPVVRPPIAPVLPREDEDFGWVEEYMAEFFPDQHQLPPVPEVVEEPELVVVRPPIVPVLPREIVIPEEPAHPQQFQAEPMLRPPVINEPDVLPPEKLTAILLNLSGNIMFKTGGRQSWFNHQTDSKVAKLRAVYAWLSDNPLTDENRSRVLALIRDICAIKRNVFGFYQPHSVQEFETECNDLDINIDDIKHIHFTKKELHHLSQESITDLIEKSIRNNFDY